MSGYKKDLKPLNERCRGHKDAQVNKLSQLWAFSHATNNEMPDSQLNQTHQLSLGSSFRDRWIPRLVPQSLDRSQR